MDEVVFRDDAPATDSEFYVYKTAWQLITPPVEPQTLHISFWYCFL